MLVEGIKSRPVYKGLTIQPHARRHIFALEGGRATRATSRRLRSRSEALFYAVPVLRRLGNNHGYLGIQ